MAEEIVKVALAEVGTKECPEFTNKTKYGEWFGFDGVPWCGIFVSWCYAQAGKPLPAIGWSKGFAGCQLALSYFAEHNKIVTKPEPGDLVFFDFNGDGRTDHVGIYVKEHPRTGIQTIEGNTSRGNNTNGGEVMIRFRKLKYMIFVRP